MSFGPACRPATGLTSLHNQAIVLTEKSQGASEPKPATFESGLFTAWDPGENEVRACVCTPVCVHACECVCFEPEENSPGITWNPLKPQSDFQNNANAFGLKKKIHSQ